MITYRVGDIFDDDAVAIVNTVNTDGVMGKGLALQFKERYPENYKLYRKACKNGDIGIGKLLVVRETVDFSERIIINFPTKTTWRRPSEYYYIQSGLEDLKRIITAEGIASIAIPPLGSHNGGLDWIRVKSMIEDMLSDMDCDIRIYEPCDRIRERINSERVRLTPARAMLLHQMCEIAAYDEFNSVLSSEKLVYFLKKLGASEEFKNISFQRGYYGPYSGGKVAHVLYHLNGSYLKGMQAMDSKPFDPIWLMDGTRESVNNFFVEQGNEKYLSILSATSKFLAGFYSQFELELLSTVDMILETNTAMGNWRELPDKKLAAFVADEIVKWNPRKGRVYSDRNYIELALGRLRAV